jgi:hypothetical protein
MKENIPQHPKFLPNEIGLKEIFFILFRGKWVIFSITSCISIIGVIFSLQLPNIYESKALLVPVSPSSSISGALGSYSSLAGLAGISIPSGGAEGNSAEAKEKLSSLSFFENSVLTNIFLPDLMAVKLWDSELGVLVYDKNIYDTSSNTWVRSYPQKKIPTPQESYDEFKTNHLRLGEDKKSGFITLSIRHQSPFVAKQWVEIVVNQINSFYRQKDKLESEAAVNYLNQQISMTGLSEIKQVIAKILQEETKKLALIEANQFYVFDYIDPPAVMEKKSLPNRALICILAAILGGMLSIIIVLLRHYYKSKDSTF